MPKRELSFIEYKERVGKAGHSGNAVVGLWNYLAEYLLNFFNTRYGEPANCTLPVQSLLELTPGWLKGMKGVGPARITVYGALYQSLKSNPAQLRDYSLDVSLDGLTFFVSTRRFQATATSAWNVMSKWLGRDATTVADVEAFCIVLGAGSERRVFGATVHDRKLLRAWLKHLQQ